MRLAAIDPGEASGVAIADVQIPAKGDVKLLYYMLTTLYSVGPIVNIITSARCKFVVMEDHPMAVGIKEQNMPHILIAEKLHNLGFAMLQGVKGYDLETKGQQHLIRIGPGLWKPVISVFRRHQPDFYGSWRPSTDHERDAMGMLMYFATINMHGRTVYYD